jgi:hypothetical protein
LAIAVVNEVKTNLSLTNTKLKHEDELDKIILYATTPDDGFELTETCRDIRV